MPRFRKKPVEVEAKRFDSKESSNDILAWIALHGAQADRTVGQGIVIHTLDGDMIASPGDWVIRGTAGEFYPCKPEIFAEIYEAVE